MQEGAEVCFKAGMVELEPKRWAEQTFGTCELGDERRTRRLVDYAARQAGCPHWSTNAVCRGDSAAAEGAYRLLRNEAVDALDICEGGFAATVESIGDLEVILATEDTTMLSFSHTSSGVAWRHRRSR